jgi:protein-tyrosine phosphatase
VIDLHSHVLHGLDDGAASLEESLDIARAAVEDGITGLAATPHVRDDYPTSVAAMGAAVAELRAALAAGPIPLELHTGGEVALDRLRLLPADELRGFALAGSRYLLVEFPYHGWPLDLAMRLFELQAAGLVPVLAHPERNADVMAAPERLEELVASGALVQVTAASLDGRLGRRTQRSGLELVRRGLAHLVASDAHAPWLRAIGMSAAAAAVGDDRMAQRLTVDVPAAIVADREIPPLTRPAPRRRSWWALRG